MKKIIFASLILASAGAATAADVGVSVTVGQPGFYGQIDIGNVRPQVIYTQPVIIERPVVGYVEQPLYLRVAPGHTKNWRKHCKRYDACGRRVYFVQDNWYNTVYVPEYRQRVERVEYRDDRRDGRRDDDHGKGKGKGHGKDKDKHGHHD